MANYHDFRFGVLAEDMSTREAWVSQAQRAEALGYSTLLIRDHFIPAFEGSTFGPVAALAVAAEVTKTLHVGTLVIDNDFRHPAVLAKEVATLHLLSQGRFELGLGAGWLEVEYQHLGIRYDAHGVRIGRLEEALILFKQLLTQERVTFTGDYYQVDGLRPFPRPEVSRPRILVGAGKKRMCRLAGREADIVGLMTVDTSTGVLIADPSELLASAVEERVTWVREGAGSRSEDIELSSTMSVHLTDDRAAYAGQQILSRGWQDVTVDDVLAMPSQFIGTIDQIIQQMKLRRERYGFSYYIVPDKSMELCAPIISALAGH